MSEWIEQDNGVKYKDITRNGEWYIIKFWGDGALYSFCDYCGHTHPCWKHVKDEEGFWILEYAPEKEYNYCPKCGVRMLGELQ